MLFVSSKNARMSFLLFNMNAFFAENCPNVIRVVQYECYLRPKMVRTSFLLINFIFSLPRPWDY